jgi:rubredoxin-NAD+ reductase
MAEGGVVIVGTGMAGYGAAREFRKWDPAAPLTLITEGDGAYYPKPQLSSALASGKSPSQLVLKSASVMAAELGATVLTGEKVTEADPVAGTLTLAQGRVLPWSNLVLAVGARLRAPKLELSGGAAIHSVNDLEGYRRLREALPDGGRLLILGAGLIGCEFAHDFASAGYRVTVVGNGSAPMAGLLPPAMAAGLRVALERLGVDFRFGDPLLSLGMGAGGLQGVLGSGTVVETDVALSAIGFDPDLDLAEKLGLACAKGIKVDGSLRTSHPRIYALGDCAEMEGRWLPFVSPLTQAAKVLGQALAGASARLELPPMPVLLKTPSHPVAMLAPAHGIQGRWEEEGDSTGVKALFHDLEGRLAGFAVSGTRYPERSDLLKRFKA